MRIMYLAFVELDVPNACRTRVIEMVHHLTEMGHEVVAILPKPLDASVLPKAVRSICLKWSFSFLGRLVFRLLAALVLLWQIMRWRPHVLYEREMECNPFPILLSRLFRIPLVVEINGLLTENYQRHPHTRWLLPIIQGFQRLELIGASAIAVPSDVVRSRLIAQYQLPPQKVKFIYNGVNTERFFPQDQKICRNKCGLPEKAFVIGFVGLAFTWYDLMTPLRALSALLPQWPGLTLVIVGDGPTRQPVHNLATELGVTNHLRWIGFQPHESIPDWINSFDVCLVPATRHCVEQYGILTTKFWEYSGCARTSIVSSLPDVPYPHELRGLMLEVIPEDLESYKEALTLCRNKPEIIQDIAQNVYRFTLEHCTWRATAKETASLMEQVTTERRPPYVGQQRTSPHSRTPY